MMEKDRQYTVYIHKNVLNGKMYIGITGKSVKERWRDGKGYNGYFKKAIDKYGWDGFKHIVFAVVKNKQEAKRLERKLIAQYETNNSSKGYNLTEGGEGCWGRIMSEETRRKISVANKGKVGWRKGLKATPAQLKSYSKAQLGKTVPCEVRAKISNSLKGRTITEEHRRKIGDAQIGIKNHMYGKKASSETKELMRKNQPKGKDHKCSVAIVQLDPVDGSVIRTWHSMSDVRRELGIKHCTISDCCRGKQKTSGGFIWRYLEESYETNEI